MTRGIFTTGDETARWGSGCLIPARLKQAVGSIVGIGGMAGALGVMGILRLTGAILTATSSNTTLLIIAGSAYLVALTAMHRLVR